MGFEVCPALGQRRSFVSRTRRATWNYATGIGFTAFSVSAGLLATPLLLHWLGDERLGAQRAATDWFGYLSLLELGLGGTLLPVLARAVTTSRDRVKAAEVSAAVAAGIQAYLVVTLFTLIGGAGLLCTILYLIPVSAGVASDLQVSCLVSLLGILLLPLAPFRLLAEARQKGYLVHGLLIVQTLVIIVLQLRLAWAGWGITGQALAILAGALIFYFLLAWDGIRRYPDTLAPLKSDSHVAGKRKELRRLNRPTFLVDLCGRVSLLTDNLVIAYLLGPAMVVPFFLTQRLVSLAQGQLQGIGNASWAALVELHLAGDHGKFNQRLIELTNVAATLGVAVLVPIAVYNHYFVSLWVGAGRFGGEWLTGVAVLNGFLQALFSLWGWAFSGTGQVGRLVRMYIAAAVVNLTVSIVCTRAFGLAGPLLGTLVAFTTVNLWWLPWLLRRVFGTSLWSLFAAVMLPLAIGLPYAVLAWWFAHRHVPWGWLGLASEMIAVALLYLVLWWWLGLRRGERILWSNRVGELLRPLAA
jgi:O-antigen/teichoic acid export membrane protein